MAQVYPMLYTFQIPAGVTGTTIATQEIIDTGYAFFLRRIASYSTNSNTVNAHVFLENPTGDIPIGYFQISRAGEIKYSDFNLFLLPPIKLYFVRDASAPDAVVTVTIYGDLHPLDSEGSVDK